MFLCNFFLKGKSAKQKNFHRINPNEFILIGVHLINSFSTNHQFAGIIMDSGIQTTSN